MVVENIWRAKVSKKIIVILVVFVAGYIVAYLTAPTKIKIVENKEDKKLIADLELKLKSKENIVIVEKPSGEKITKIVRVVEKQEKDNSVNKVKVETKYTEILNPKKLSVSVGVLVDSNILTKQTYLADFTYNFWGNFLIGGGAMFGNSTAGIIKLGYQF